MTKVIKKILLIIISIPLLIIAFIIFTAVFNICGALIIAFILTSVACTAGGAGALIFGFINVFGLPEIGLAAISAGMFTIALAIVFICVSIIFIKKLMPVLVNCGLSSFRTIKKIYITKPVGETDSGTGAE